MVSSSGDAGIVAVELIEVDPVGAKPPQARLDALSKVPSRESPIVRPRPHRPVDLRRQDDLGAQIRLGEELPENLLAAPGGVDIGGVPERHPGVACGPQNRERIFLARRFAEVHAAEAEVAHLQPGAPQRCRLRHVLPSPSGHPSKSRWPG